MSSSERHLIEARLEFIHNVTNYDEFEVDLYQKITPESWQLILLEVDARVDPPPGSLIFFVDGTMQKTFVGGLTE